MHVVFILFVVMALYDFSFEGLMTFGVVIVSIMIMTIRDYYLE